MGEYILTAYLNTDNIYNSTKEKYKWVIYSNIMDKEIWDSFNETINYFKREIESYGIEVISPETIENIKVEYYGSMVPLKDASNINKGRYNEYYIEPYQPEYKIEIFNRIHKYFSYDPNIQVIQTDNHGIKVLFPKIDTAAIKAKEREITEICKKYTNQIKQVYRTYLDELRELNKEITLEERKLYQQALDSRKNHYQENINKIEANIKNSLRL